MIATVENDAGIGETPARRSLHDPILLRSTDIHGAPFALLQFCLEMASRLLGDGIRRCICKDRRGSQKRHHRDRRKIAFRTSTIPGNKDIASMVESPLSSECLLHRTRFHLGATSCGISCQENGRLCAGPYRSGGIGKTQIVLDTSSICTNLPGNLLGSGDPQGDLLADYWASPSFYICQSNRSRTKFSSSMRSNSGSTA